jgi:hypothetical protein
MTAAQNGSANRLVWTQVGNNLSDLSITQNGGQAIQISLDGRFTASTLNATVNVEGPNPTGANQGPMRRIVRLRGRRTGECTAPPPAALPTMPTPQPAPPPQSAPPAQPPRS